MEACSDAVSNDVIGYLSGPVDAREVYTCWEKGEPTAYFGTSYLQQFFTVISKLGGEAHVITSHDGEAYDVRRGSFLLSNRPKASNLLGWRYHWTQMRWTAAALSDLEASHCRVLVLTDAQNYWFLTVPLRLRRKRFINALHCAIWPAFTAKPLHLRLLAAANRLAHYAFGDTTLSASPLITRQLEQLPSKVARRVLSFLPNYLPEHFAAVGAPRESASRSVNVLYAGRIERNKGVFDLLEAAEILKERGHTVTFDICGEGSARAELLKAATDRKMSHTFQISGFCDRLELVRRFDASDIVVVPTRTDFEEGFAMIVAEGVIAGRPVVTSRVCPALEVVSEACVEVEPDDPAAYANAISALITDSNLYRKKLEAARRLSSQFFDSDNSYGAKLTLALASLSREGIRKTGYKRCRNHGVARAFADHSDS